MNRKKMYDIFPFIQIKNFYITRNTGTNNLWDKIAPFSSGESSTAIL